MTAEVPLGVTTVTSVTPAAPLGEVAVIEVPDPLTVTPVAATPAKSTAVAPVNPEPVMVTGIPPVVYPVAGVTLATIGPYGAASVSKAPMSQGAVRAELRWSLAGQPLAT